jgi:hypothetical protein
MATVVADWPSGWQDVNPIENMWPILKDQEEELRRGTKEELINLAIEPWKPVYIALANNFVRYRPERLQEMIRKQGNPTHN